MHDVWTEDVIAVGFSLVTGIHLLCTADGLERIPQPREIQGGARSISGRYVGVFIPLTEESLVLLSVLGVGQKTIAGMLAAIKGFKS